MNRAFALLAVLCQLVLLVVVTHAVARHDGNDYEKLLQKIIDFQTASTHGRVVQDTDSLADEEPKLSLTDSVVNRYTTTEVFNLDQDQTMTFYAPLCEQAVDQAVNVSLLLIHNPGWEPVKGIIEYQVARGDSLDPEVLCTNVAGGISSPNCLIGYWPDLSDMMIIATAGPVSGIAFNLHAEFFHANSETASYIRRNVPPRPSKSVVKPYSGGGSSMETLLHTAIIYPPIFISYQQQAIVTLVWCNGFSNHEDVFSVESTVMATDMQSAFTQHICDQSDCEVGQHNIAYNGNQLTSNTVVTDNMRYAELTFLITSWGGTYDPAKNNYIGQFLFQAQVHLL